MTARTATVKVGVAGAGYISNLSHLPTLSRLAEANLVAICDENLEQARIAARRFGVPHTYVRLDDMLAQESMDLIDICIPPQRHRAALAAALERGLPCLVEKPLTVTTADADAVLALAEEKGLGLHVIHNMSVLPGILRARAMVEEGVIGRLLGVDIKYLVPWERRHLDPDHWCHRLPGGYLSEVGPHLAMLLVEFLGSVREVQSVAHKASSYPVHPDELRILARCEAGLGTITCSLNCPSRLLTVDLFGTKGALHVNGDYQAVVHYRPIDSSHNAFARGLGGARDILARTVGLAKTTVNVLARRYEVENYGHHYLMKRSLLSLLGRGTYPVSAQMTREAVRLLELAFQHIENTGIS